MKKINRISKILLVIILLFGAVYNVNININASGVENIALGKTVTASDEETPFVKGQIVDGDLSTRWGTNQNKAVDEWINIALGESKKVRQIEIHFERSDAEQNILAYKVELKSGDTYETVFTKNERAKQHEIIQLDQDYNATDVKVTILNADGGELNWVNVGINEIEVYSELVEAVENTNDKNHMLNATVTTSSNELVTLDGSKVKDGGFERNERWASGYETPTTDIWLEATFPQLTQVKEIKIFFFTRDVAPIPSNVEKFNIKYTDRSGVEKALKTDYEVERDGDGYKTNIKIVLDETVDMKALKLDGFVANASQYNNISISELEVYSNDQKDRQTLDSVIASIQEKTIENTATELVMPTVPEGFTIAFNGADFEQIIAKDGTIYHPLTDKAVNVSFEVTETATEKKKKTADIVYTVKGKHEQLPAKNTKPMIVPEIAEWYSDSNDTLAINDITKVVYNDASFDKIVDEFIADYKDFTGITLNKVKGNESANAYNFLKTSAVDQLDEEGYAMQITNDRVVAKAESITGNMFAMQTILQMYKQNQESFKIGSMRDYPRFETRGLLLDIARKPVSMEMIKEISRTMRYFKMNDFQVHLSDNYIFLEDYGKGENENEAFKAYEAFRLESGLSNDKGETPTALDYSISKKDFNNFITDQRSLGMKIVPEIDVPAHATSFTKIWPEIMVKGQVSPLNRNRPLIDHIDVSKPEAVDKIKEIFDDYTRGSNPTFDAQTTVHIGADEFVTDYTAFRNMINTLVPHVKETNPVRMWGGLTWIDDNKTEITQEAIENVEMNLWSSAWADGIQMYNMGYKLINTIDDYGYIVPNGSKNRGNAYADLLNINRIFDSFAANRVKTGSGYQFIPSGDEQVLGAAFAIWNDNIDKKSVGLTESDLYWRFFDAMPFYAEKTWAATGKEKGTAAELSKLAEEQGSGPRTNPYYQENKKGKNYESYDFNNGLEDGSGNDRDLTTDSTSNAVIKNDALVLGSDAEKVSFVSSPIDALGNGNQLSFDITLDKIAQPGQILFEKDAPYATHDIRIMDDGRLGFTREQHDYYFDYELPVNKKVNVRIEVEQQSTKLYVDGEFNSAATGRFFHYDMVKKENIKYSTFALPLARIGSKTNAISATFDNIIVTENSFEDEYGKANWTATTNSETNLPTSTTEGLVKYAFDNKSETIWHTNWNGATDKLDGTNSFYAEINFNEKYEINQFSFTPRGDTASGLVTKADLFIKANESDEWIKVASDQIFAADANKKTFYFDKQEVQFVKFVAKGSNDGWVAVSEFDIMDKKPSTFTVFVNGSEGGSVSGGKEASLNEEVTVSAKANRGFTFDGWYRNTGEKVSTDSEYTFAVNANTALTAKFIRSSYLVIINGEEFDIPVGETVTKPQDPVKEGYNFIGWFVDGTPYDFTAPVNENLTIEPKFEKMILTVTADGVDYQVAYGDRLPQLKDPVKEGFVFVGWYKDGNLYDFSQPVTSSFVLTPKFESVTTEVVDKSELQNLIANAITDYTGYTKESVQIYKAALENARNVLADKDATQAEVNAAIMKLKDAKLVKSTTNPETSDTTNNVLWISLMLVAGGYILTRKRDIKE